MFTAHTEETKAKMREAWKRRRLIPVSAETRQKMSAARKGRKFSEEHKKKLSEALMGIERPTGWKHSEESRKKMSANRAGIPRPDLEGRGNHKWIDGRSSDIEFKRLKIRLQKHHRRTLGKVTREMWSDLKEQYGHKCPACGEAKPLTLDHIVPVFLGGTNDLWNLQPLCQECNSRKGTTIKRYEVPCLTA